MTETDRRAAEQPPIHPIEQESYRLLAAKVDLSAWPPGPAAVVARVVHATAEPALVDRLVVPERAVDAGVAALRADAPVLCDVEMVRAGIAGVRAICTGGEVDDRGPHPSRSAAAMARAAAAHPDGAVIVVGCAPTALAEVNRLIDAGELRPALVIGTPVGYVGAAEAKEALLSVAERTGVPAIALRGDRGGAAVAASILNALVRLSGRGQARPRTAPSLLVIGHGTRSPGGTDELRRFAGALQEARPSVAVGAGFIEFVEPSLDRAIDALVERGAARVVGVPLLLLGAGHLKDDGPGALARARRRHAETTFTYARELGVHPLVLATMEDRIRQVPFAHSALAPWPGGPFDAVVVVGRGSTDPDANADLVKAARLLADGRGLATGGQRSDEVDGATPALGFVEPAFVSLARPGVAEALERCHSLGARRIAVVPYFLFTGLLVERIGEVARAWAGGHPDTEVALGAHMGIDDRLVELTWSRYDEALGEPVTMNCDGCLYRAPLPGYEHRVGTRPGSP
jgi:precorrin isomerase/sirohydrochlorin ferrochelatase